MSMRTNNPVSEEAARLGAALRLRRQKLKLTQKALAEAARTEAAPLDQPEVARIEKGIRFPSIPQLAALAAVLKTTPSRLLGTSHG